MSETGPLKETPSQTAGPYLHIALAPDGVPIAGPDVPGRRIRIGGRIFDGTGEPVRDALVEIWQADAAGIYHAMPTPDGFRGWGRAATDFETGAWSVETIKPGAVGAMAPHLTLWIVARGINMGLQTRLYFPDEAATRDDPVLAAIMPAERRQTLIARRQQDDESHYEFDIRLQGAHETVFFDI